MNTISLKTNLDYAVVSRSLVTNAIEVDAFFKYRSDAIEYAQAESEHTISDYAVIARAGYHVYFHCGNQKQGLVMPAFFDWEE